AEIFDFDDRFVDWIHNVAVRRSRLESPILPDASGFSGVVPTPRPTARARRAPAAEAARRPTGRAVAGKLFPDKSRKQSSQSTSFPAARRQNISQSPSEKADAAELLRRRPRPRSGFLR